MKTEKNIFIAFILNLCFSVFELFGGIFTGSVAIVSDSIHDLGDALSIGISFAFEKISHKNPDGKHTFGYYRYSVLGSVIQSVILLCGSVLVIYNAVERIIHPEKINYNGMIIIAVFGFIINFFAAYFTSGEGSLNQKAINLHMLEDVLGWAIVLIGAIVMRFTNWYYIDAILSILLAIFILVNSLKSLKTVLDIFLEKTPEDINYDKIKEHLLSIEGVCDIHHLHIWSMDGYSHGATLHVVTDSDFYIIKSKIKEELSEHGISHATVECEKPDEKCDDIDCNVNNHCHDSSHSHHHHHHHH